MRRRDDGVAVVLCDSATGLEQALADIQEDGSIHAAVLTLGSSGSSIGPSLQVMRSVQTQAEGEAMVRAGHVMVERLASHAKPIVAAVHGPVLGRGFELALGCHGRVTSDDAATYFALPEVKLGLLPMAHGLQRLTDLAGLRAALDYGLTGKPMFAGDAKRHGVAQEVVPHAGIEDAAAKLALSLVDRHAMREEPGGLATQAWSERLARSVLEDHRPGRHLLLRRARKTARSVMGVHFRGPGRILDVLSVHASKGFAASRPEEARAAGELLVSSTARRLMELFLGIGELTKREGLDVAADELAVIRDAVPGPASAARPMLGALLREAGVVVTEGATIEFVRVCLAEWGWGEDALSRLDEIGPGSSRTRTAVDAPTIPREEIQMRCSLQFVNQALRCLADGEVSSPLDGDVGAVVGTGFPAFRGGPFRYVDAIGAPQILRRIETYRSRFGERWAPAPLLVQLAEEDRRIHRRSAFSDA